MRRTCLILSACLAGLLSACSGGATPTTKEKVHPSPISSGHVPGPVDVSTTNKGKPFDATPNFYWFQTCGRPCWLPLYPNPEIQSDAKVTDNYPYEKLPGNPGNTVHVVCQYTVPDKDFSQQTQLRDNAGHVSAIWDLVLVPEGAKNVLGNAAMVPSDLLLAPKAGSGHYAFGADLWLGNTGDHSIPCDPNKL